MVRLSFNNEQHAEYSLNILVNSANNFTAITCQIWNGKGGNRLVEAWCCFETKDSSCDIGACMAIWNSLHIKFTMFDIFRYENRWCRWWFSIVLMNSIHKIFATRLIINVAWREVRFHPNYLLVRHVISHSVYKDEYSCCFVLKSTPCWNKQL